MQDTCKLYQHATQRLTYVNMQHLCISMSVGEKLHVTLRNTQRKSVKYTDKAVKLLGKSVNFREKRVQI